MSALKHIMKFVGWAGTLGAGALAAKGLGEFLPASKLIVYGVGGGLEIMNIVASPGLPAATTAAGRSRSSCARCAQW